LLPGLFVIGGILGTFFGIVNGLPKLAEMKLDDITTTKNIMDNFLTEISGAMISSITGIIFSVAGGQPLMGLIPILPRN
jgi:hypothetical protein